MAVCSYILKNQYSCEECAKQMGRVKNTKEWGMVNPEKKKCTLCGQKKDCYHSRYYTNIEDAAVQTELFDE